MKTKRMPSRFMFAIMGLLVSCSATGTGLSQSEGSFSGDVVTVRVVTSGGPVMAGSEVLLVSRQGISLLGVTDSLGTVSIPRARIWGRDDVYALLICAEYHFCGALRLDDSNVRESYYVALAPYAID